MSKYIIEIDDDLSFDVQFLQAIGAEPNGVVRIRHIEFEKLEELNSDYINENFGDLQDTAYQRGLNDAWEAARKIVLDEGIDMNTLCTIFGRGCSDSIIRDYSASEAIAKLKAYEEKQKADDSIIAGDEVKAEDGTVVFIITWMSDRCICGVDKDGKCYSYEPKEICGKTGRHFDIDKILEEMKE